jgi:malate dehydrogenase (oxaloacetate-decarboxylating)(NADP+)
VKIGGAETIGPILMGMSRPVHVLHRGAEVEEIVDIAAIAVVDAQETEALVEREAAKRERPSQEEQALALETLRR